MIIEQHIGEAVAFEISKYAKCVDEYNAAMDAEWDAEDAPEVRELEESHPLHGIGVYTNTPRMVHIEDQHHAEAKEHGTNIALLLEEAIRKVVNEVLRERGLL